MKGFLLAAALTWVQFSPYPLRGQSPGSREGSSDQISSPKPAEHQTQLYQRGTKDAPLFIQNLSDNNKNETAAAEVEKQHKALIDGLTIGIGAAVALFNLLLVIIGWKGVGAANRTLKAIETQGRVMERQADLMGFQLKQAARHLTLTERPWLVTRLSLAGPFEYYTAAPPPRMHIHLLIEVTNEGKTPAINIEVQPSAYVRHLGLNIAKTQRDVGETVKGVSKANPIFGEMLFPGKGPLIKRWTIPVTISDIERYGHADGIFNLEIIVGVGYRSTIDDEACHCTVTLYDFFRTEPNQVGHFAFFKGQALPIERLGLRPSDMAPVAE